MTNKLSDFFYRKSNKLTLLIVCIIYAGFMLWSGVFSSSVTIKPFDLTFGYDSNFVHTFLGNLSKEQRQEYIRFLLVFDTLYPLVYGTFLTLLMSYFGRTSLLKKWNLIPYISVFFDYLENCCNIMLTSSYPNFSETTVIFGSTFTILKWVYVIISFVIITLLLIRHIKKTMID
jgi:hypothetical protein